MGDLASRLSAFAAAKSRQNRGKILGKPSANGFAQAKSKQTSSNGSSKTDVAMSNHNRTTRIKRPIIREGPATKSGRAIMIRIEADKLVIWEKRTRTKHVVTFTQLMRDIRVRALAAARVARCKARKKDRRQYWADMFLNYRRRGLSYFEIVNLLREQNIKRDNGQPWAWYNVRDIVRSEIGRIFAKIQPAVKLYKEATLDPSSALPQLLRSVSDDDSLVRHVAAIQLALHHPRRLPESAKRELLNTLVHVTQNPDDRSFLTSWYGAITDDGQNCWNLAEHITLAFAHLPVGSADFAVPELVGLWQRDRQRHELVLAAVTLTFHKGKCPCASGLSPLQRLVLEAMVKDAELWEHSTAAVSVLGSRGLPSSMDGMQAFLPAPAVAG